MVEQVQCQQTLFYMVKIIQQKQIHLQKMVIHLLVGMKVLMVQVLIGQIGLENLGSGNIQKILRFMRNGKKIITIIQTHFIMMRMVELEHLHLKQQV